jgi:hypothetical protein
MSSMESAMISRETSEVRWPSVPIPRLSDTAGALNSNGVPPASRMPALTCSASRRWFTLHGIAPDQVVATAMRGLRRSASVRPIAQ